ncbi:MAG TPA: pyrroloquinoline quinone biosynthesis protein PqqB [Candidatus Acidoferrum sp.]|nr:pyrroloquinoline quinone biosynthesis protein PqqB [Candidatus Acidoferrum sp.]
MRIKILGSAAGGGFPQWNCACSNCRRFRAGQFRGPARTQTQIAIDANPEYAQRQYWTLVNASPDLRQQVLATRELKPFSDGHSSTPIRDVYLPSADVDSLMGLLHLREFQGFRILSTPAVRRIVSEENSIFRVLGRAAPPVEWVSLEVAATGDTGKHHNPEGPPLLFSRAISLGGEYPDYVSGKLRPFLAPDEAVMGFVFDHCGKRLFVAPSLPNRNTGWKDWAASSDVVLVDGTFWSDTELIQAGRSHKTAREIGHLPLSGPGGLLEQFPKSSTARKILIHINNTNPILDEDSAEHRAVLEAGFEIAYDGMELQL